MINEKRIASMKKGAILINVARGAVVDEEALTKAIESEHLGGIGVDVFSEEPFRKDHPYSRILQKENVFLTPHMAWGSFEARTRCIKIISENISSFMSNNDKNRII